MMPVSLPLRPGVDVMQTPLQVGMGMVDSNLIRHRNGLIQKMAGCRKLTNLQFTGLCRCLFPWQDLQGNHYLAIGTNQILQIFANNVLNVILPVTTTTNLAHAAFSTVQGSSAVTIIDAGASPSVGSWIQIYNLTYINGISLQGPYQVQSTGGGNTYTITASNNANATGSGASTLAFTTTNGQSAVVIALGSYVFINSQSIQIGVATTVGGIVLATGSYTVTVVGSLYTISGVNNATSGATVSENTNQTRISYFAPVPQDGGASAASGGFGLGAFGSGPYNIGTGTVSNSGQQGSMPNVLFTVEWSMDRWGQNLVFCWIGSTVYQWVPPLAAGNFAVPVGGSAPAAVNGLFVAAPQQQTMAWGISSAALSGAQDPLLVGWCDVANLPVWAASTTNQAGSFRLSSGNLIIGGTWFGTVGLFWTDIDLWSMTFVGFPLVYGFNKVAPNCGLIARRAWATMGTLVAWMSQNDFFIYQGGAVQPLPCTVRDFVFNSIDLTRAEEIHADSNTYSGEITWWFPQVGSNGVCTGAVKWHPQGGEWDIIQSGLSVSAWTDQSVFGQPIGSFYNNYLEQFETAVDFDGQILDSFIMSGIFQIESGEQMYFIERVYPDFNISSGGIITWTFYFADSMADMEAGNFRTYGPYQVTSSTPFIIVRGRGRVMQHRIDCNVAPNTFWRYGEPLAQVQVDGRRP